MAWTPDQFPLGSASVTWALGALGLIAGSFVSALSYRMPRGQSIAAGRSRCPSCGTELGVADLVPVLSWMFNRGRCRHCRAPVSWRYPAIELTTMATLISAGVCAPSITALAIMVVVAPVLITLAVIDLEHGRLPNVLIMCLAVLMVLWRWQTTPAPVVIAQSFGLAALVWLAGGVVSAVSSRRRGAPMLGSGDAKMMAASALGLPPWQVVVFLGMAGALATIFIVVWRARRPVTQAPAGAEAPFGPALAAAIWVCLVWPDLYRSFAP